MHSDEILAETYIHGRLHDTISFTLCCRCLHVDIMSHGLGIVVFPSGHTKESDNQLRNTL